MENNVRSEKSINDLKMENTPFEGVLDLSKFSSIHNKTIDRPTRFEISQNSIVPVTNEEDVKISNSSSVSGSFKKYYSSSATGSSINIPHFSTYGASHSIASHVSSDYNNSSHSGIELHNKPFTPEFKKSSCDMLQKEHDSEPVPVMSNVEFYSLLEPLQEKINEASARIQSLIGSKTESDLERDNTYSLFTQFKMHFTPHMQAVQSALESIPKVLAPPTAEKDIEIGDTSKKFKISQAAFDKAVSKTNIKDAALALIECDTFLPKSEKLSATIGRPSNSTVTGKLLTPLETDMLTALYKLLADKSKMVNIQRLELCKALSPDCLTYIEQKMVREALSQYFNQQRQKEKRKRVKIDCHSDDSNQQHRDNK